MYLGSPLKGLQNNVVLFIKVLIIIFNVLLSIICVILLQWGAL